MRWETVLAIDFDKSACETYRANFPNVRVVQCDLKERLNILKPKMADVVLGGPPCPPFSKGGLRKGKNDERNCIPEYTQAVKIIGPRMFLMEQVDGILHGNSGSYFVEVIRDLEKLGYAVQYRCLDAVNFGVPQFRKRVWVWGIRNDIFEKGIKHCWPEPTHCWPPLKSGFFKDKLLPAVSVGNAINKLSGKIIEWRWKDIQLRKHPPTPLDKPSSTVIKNWCRGLPQGLVLIAKKNGKLLSAKHNNFPLLVMVGPPLWPTFYQSALQKQIMKVKH